MSIRVEHLKKYFGATRAVDDLCFSVEPGQVYGFVGPNGAGKTTTMRIMATLEEPSSGDVLIDGHSVTQAPEKVRMRIGYVPDSLPSPSHTTVFELLDFFARAQGLRGSHRSRVLREIEEFTNLGPLRHKLVDQCSKGMKQRVSLARALLHDPKILIMDEPAAGLDPKARIELRELVRILAGQGRAIFISSHILGELSEMCDGAVIIEQGKLLHAGPMQRVLQEERHTRTMWIRAAGPAQELYRALLQTAGVEEAELIKQDIRVTVPASDEYCAGLLKQLIEKDFPIVEFRRHKADLEEVFMKVTRGRVQ